MRRRMRSHSYAAFVAAPRQRAMPEPPYLESKDPQRVVVLGHSVIADVSTHHRLQPFALVEDGFVHPSLKLGFHLVQFRLQLFADRLPQYRKPPIAPLLHADVRKTEEIERLRFPFSTPLPLVDRVRTKLQKSRLLGMQFQVELPHSFRKFRSELIGIRFAVESHHDVIREAHDDDITVCPLLTPRLDPQVEYVMKIDVCQKRRSTSALGRPFLRPYSFPILQHAGVQPFLDEPHDAPICDPVLHELHKPFVRKAIRYYRSVRHRRTSLDFPTRPKATAALGGLGISRFPREVLSYVHGVSDRAGLWHTSRFRCTRWGLPLLLTASASRSEFLTRLNTRPARSPVNASTPPLRVAPH